MNVFKACKLFQKKQSQILLKSLQFYRSTIINPVKKSSPIGDCLLQNTFRCYSTFLISPKGIQGNLLTCNYGRNRTYIYSSIRWNYEKRRLDLETRRKNVVYFSIAIFIFMLGGAYLAVPLYRIFCQKTGLGGKSIQDEDSEKVENLTPIKNRKITVTFNADVAASMRWNFRPQQTRVEVYPGETALAFYTARNPTDSPVIGISTYNVIPYEAALYFNKIQCFCFEEQRLNPHEQVDMPVFFYIDPDFVKDPALKDVNNIMLSYTFFEARNDIQLPGFIQPTPNPLALKTT